jgi:hypothetical protein
MGGQNPTSPWQELLARDRSENDINRQRHAASLMSCSFSDIQGICDFVNIYWALKEKWVLGIQIYQTSVPKETFLMPT